MLDQRTAYGCKDLQYGKARRCLRIIYATVGRLAFESKTLADIVQGIRAIDFGFVEIR